MTTVTVEREGGATTSRRRSPVLVAGAVAAVLAAVLVWWRLAGDARPEVPYTDAASVGRLTLCDSAGSATSAGSTTDLPFASRVVGETPAAAGFEGGAGGAAVLFAYQPRLGVGSDEWSGLQLTAPTPYDGTAAAAAVSAQATTLGQFLAGYPAVADGFVQLRLVVQAPGQATPLTYDSLDLHIDGDRWQAVGVGDPAACR